MFLSNTCVCCCGASFNLIPRHPQSISLLLLPWLTLSKLWPFLNSLLLCFLPQVQSGTSSEWSWLWQTSTTMSQTGAWSLLPTWLWFHLMPLRAHLSTSSMPKTGMKATTVKWSTSCQMVGYFFFLLFSCLSDGLTLLFKDKVSSCSWLLTLRFRCQDSGIVHAASLASGCINGAEWVLMPVSFMRWCWANLWLQQNNISP